MNYSKEQIKKGIKTKNQSKESKQRVKARIKANPFYFNCILYTINVLYIIVMAGKPDIS
jgi:hypothetical protein